MKEMNPDVETGNFEDMAVSDFVKDKADVILNSQLVIACDVGDGLASQISDICESKNIPLIILRQYGMLGYIRLQKSEDCIVEPKIA